MSWGYRGPILRDTLPWSLIVDEARVRGLGTGGSGTERLTLVRVRSVRGRGGVVESIWDWEGSFGVRVVEFDNELLCRRRDGDQYSIRDRRMGLMRKRKEKFLWVYYRGFSEEES